MATADCQQRIDSVAWNEFHIGFVAATFVLGLLAFFIPQYFLQEKRLGLLF